jgi:hypothetical protein
VFGSVLYKMPRVFFFLFYETVSERCTFVGLGMLHERMSKVAQPSYDSVKFLFLSTGQAVIWCAITQRDWPILAYCIACQFNA